MQINDQTNINFVLNQVTAIEKKVYAKKYPDIQYPVLIPIDRSANPWIKTVTFFSSDESGAAKFIDGAADDIPTVSGNRQKFESSVYMAAIGYSFSLEEVNQARMMGVSLSNDDAAICRRVYERTVDSIMLVGSMPDGSNPKGFEGITNYTGISIIAAPNGAGGSPLMMNKTDDEIVADVNNLLSGIPVDSLGIELANTLLLSEAHFLVMSNKRMDGTTMTLLQYIRNNNIMTARYNVPLTIRTARGLETAGAGNVSRMVAYRNDEEVLKAHIPMPIKFQPTQIVNLQYKTPAIFRLGGLDIRLPMAVRYLDGM